MLIGSALTTERIEILSPRIFAMMVLMALLTTFSTAPLLALADRLRKRSAVPVDMENGPAMLDLKP